MAEQTRTVIQIRNFTGVDLTSDRRDQQPGQSVEQVNVTNTQDGQLRSRGGFQFVSFEGEVSPA